MDANTPPDYADPQWSEARRVHDWRNYIDERLRQLWPTFNDEQKQAIAESAEAQASREEWD